MQKEQPHYEIIDQCLIIYVCRDLDHHQVTALKEQADRLMEAGNIRHVIFDFQNVGFMDSSGIGLIMGRYNKVVFYGGRTAVCHIGAEVERIFSLSGLFRIIERYDTLEEALQELGVCQDV